MREHFNQASSTSNAQISPARRALPTPLIFFFLAVAVCVSYTLYTSQVWEDYFITFRYSENLCHGKGLVYNAGERVHGFTSPLGVLLPAACYLISGMGSYVPALWLFRISSMAAFAGGGLFVLAAFRLDNSSSTSQIFMALLYVFDVKAVAFATNGMETAFMLLFVGWAFYLFQRECCRPWFTEGGHGLPLAWSFARGACWAGLLWTRPDGCVYIGALAIAGLTFSQVPRWRLLASFLSSAAVCSLLYAPWLLFAWFYYSSPIPNTLIAKSTYIGGNYLEYLQLIRASLGRQFLLKNIGVFAPIYYTSFWGWPAWVGWISLAMVCLCCIYWLLPNVDRLGRMASLCCLLLCLYNLAVPALFPWYMPPIAMCGIIALTRGTPRLTDALLGPGVPSGITAATCLMLPTLGSIGLFLSTAYQARIQQEVIENGQRMTIGKWLKDTARPFESVYVEPLGYIGYFSGCRMLDYPGLISPRVVKLRQRENLDFVSIIALIQPDWVVARPEQARDIGIAGLTDFYVPVRRFDVKARLDQYSWVPGRLYLGYDTVFVIFKKKPGLAPVR
jgi:hypothetical protein